jgi:hypothetical protein
LFFAAAAASEIRQVAKAPGPEIINESPPWNWQWRKVKNSHRPVFLPGSPGFPFFGQLAGSF